MARKKLNKKVVIIGLLALVFIAVCGIVVILRLSQGADKFIKDGDVALEAARQAVDEEIKEELQCTHTLQMAA